MVDEIKKPFKLAASPQKDNQTIRDKDNTAPHPPPPRWSRTPALNIAARGALGIKMGLPAPKPKSVKHSFTKGDLKKSFKPIAAPSHNKNKDIER
ncbi:MAG: hypothetical protein COB24_12655 [Hyphomicrobiales bacterium]|nr:MAG: hypothetical protein COB24_12655 [Hyphomicrobiales bacterium]